jgi:hypothetical protein
VLDNLTKWVSTLAPFLAPYPAWVKAAFVIFVLSGAAWFVGLVIAPTATSEKPPSSGETAWLTIKGVTAFGSYGDDIRVTATVNGINYIYPTLPGVTWMEIGPDMAPQIFQIPVRELYSVRFSAQTKGGSSLASVEEQRVVGTTDGIKAYGLRGVSGGVRSAPVAVEVRYTITKNAP